MTSPLALAMTESRRWAVRSSLVWVQELISPAPTRTASPAVGAGLGVSGAVDPGVGERVLTGAALEVVVGPSACSSELLVSRNVSYMKYKSPAKRTTPGIASSFHPSIGGVRRQQLSDFSALLLMDTLGVVSHSRLARL